MKIINHKKGNESFANDGAVMHGTITMTAEEWRACDVYLRGVYKKAEKECNTYIRDNLSNLFGTDRKMERPWAKVFYIGETAIKLIVLHYNVENYKKGNYQIIIK